MFNIQAHMKNGSVVIRGVQMNPPLSLPLTYNYITVKTGLLF